MKNYTIKKRILFFYVCFFYISAFPFNLGVENVSSSTLYSLLQKKPIVGLITNQTGVTQQDKRTIDTVHKNNGCTLRYIFVPEHGLTGIAAERDVFDSVDSSTSIPIVSLYGNGTGKMINPEHLQEIDVLIFDIQDSGMRHYTYISTLLNTMKIAAEYNKPFVVFDRPNPLGSLMHGPLVESDLMSFISIAPIPLRHGMTIGELARYFNRYIVKKPATLYVVSMSGYNRSQGFMGPWLHQLSPNIQSLQSCIGYSFLGLMGEIEPFDVGVGTSMAFRCITLPESVPVDTQQWKQLKNILYFYDIESSLYQHTNPRTKKITKGLRLQFPENAHFNSFELFITIMEFFKKHSIPFSFSQSFDKAVGSKKVKDVILGKIPKKLFFKEIDKDIQLFKKQTLECLLYQ